MNKLTLAILLTLLPLQADAKIKTVVLDPAAGGTDNGVQTRLFHEKELSLRFAKMLMPKLKKNKSNVILTRFDDYPLTDFDRVSIANKQEKALWISLHFSKAIGPPRISIYTLGNLDSSRIETNFLIPIEKAHRPWISRSKLLAQTLEETLGPTLSPSYHHLNFPIAPLLGVNHPGVMIEFEINTTTANMEELESLIAEASERISIAVKTFIKKEKKL